MKPLLYKSAASATLVAILLATVVPLEWRPPTILSTDLDRMLAFAFLMSFLVLGFPKRWRQALLAALLTPLVLEAAQLLAPTRHAEFHDAVIKMSGGVAGVMLTLLLMKLIEPLQTKFKQERGQRHLRRMANQRGLVDLPVKSRMIEAVSFSSEDGRLRITFSDGHQGLFEGVTQSDAVAMVTAPSPGRYYLHKFKPRFKRAA